MLGRQDLKQCQCWMCHGSGKDPKKRSRNCPECNGSGIGYECTRCGGVYGKDCIDSVCDQTQCTMENTEKQNETIPTNI